MEIGPLNLDKLIQEKKVKLDSSMEIKEETKGNRNYYG